MGGFVKEHATDIDSNKDGELTFEEFVVHLRPMFTKQDRNQDGKLAPDEWRDLAPDSPDQPPRRNRGEPENPRPRGGDPSGSAAPRTDPRP